MSEAARSPLHVESIRERLARLADGLAVAVALTLPWSVTAASIAIVLWLLAVLPTLRWDRLGSILPTPAAAMPLLMFALALVGLTWTPATFSDQFGNLKTFARLLLIILLLVQFWGSPRALWVAGGFLASCTVLLAVSWLFWLVPSIAWPSRFVGAPVKDYIIQSGEFLICAFALGHLSLNAWQDGRRARAFALGLLGLLFLANILYVAASRSALIALLVLVPLFVIQRFGWKQAVIASLLAVLAVTVAWTSSSHLRFRVLGVAQEVSNYQTRNQANSSSFRLVFWTRSIEIIARAPVVGHGTGAQREQFRRAAEGRTGIAAAVTDNPHNQTMLVAIQFGAVGTVLLFAMWLAHLLLFRGDGLAAWIGTALVAQNVIAGLFNTSLLEFTHSWLYIFGVGALGALMLGRHQSEAPPGARRP